MDILPRAAASKRQKGSAGVMPLGIMYDDDRELFTEASELHGSAGRSDPDASGQSASAASLREVP